MDTIQPIAEGHRVKPLFWSFRGISSNMSVITVPPGTCLSTCKDGTYCFTRQLIPWLGDLVRAFAHVELKTVILAISPLPFLSQNIKEPEGLRPLAPVSSPCTDRCNITADPQRRRLDWTPAEVLSSDNLLPESELLMMKRLERSFLVRK